MALELTEYEADFTEELAALDTSNATTEAILPTGEELAVTYHAYDRMKERMGWNKPAGFRMAKKAYLAGIDYENACHSVKWNLSREVAIHKRAGLDCVIKILHEYVFCFVRETNPVNTENETIFKKRVVLVTAFQLRIKDKRIRRNKGTIKNPHRCYAYVDEQM